MLVNGSADQDHLLGGFKAAAFANEVHAAHAAHGIIGDNEVGRG